MNQVTGIASTPVVAIVDYGSGNLFSIRQACLSVELEPVVTASPETLLAADAVILPGVGAFGDAMAALRRLDLIGPLIDLANSGKSLVGICLGMQLLMSESFEFGQHKGLNLVEGEVVRLEAGSGPAAVKIPQVGWDRIRRPSEELHCDWSDTLLDGVSDGEFMYFVHSFIAQPSNPEAVLAVSQFAESRFCSALRVENVIGFQFHPERSADQGLKIYSNLRRQLATLKQEKLANEQGPGVI
jgi:glutamine amidotransferase